jgi:hypothetical protein
VPEGLIVAKRTSDDDQERPEMKVKPREAAFAVDRSGCGGSAGEAVRGSLGNEFGVSLVDVLKLLVGHFVPHHRVLQC